MDIKEMHSQIADAKPEPIQLITPEAVMPVNKVIEMLEVIEKACDVTNSIGMIELVGENGLVETMKIEDAVRRITSRFITTLEYRAREVMNG